MLTRTSLNFDIEGVRQATTDLIKKVGWGPTGQLALTRALTIPDGIEPFHHAVGDLIDPDTGRQETPEHHFRHLDDRLVGTCFEEIYTRLSAGIPERIARMRLMAMAPRTCYSYHADDEYRYHLAIVTHPTAFAIFEDLPPQHIPADGFIYGFDARKKHTAMNCGQSARIHLVVTTY